MVNISGSQKVLHGYVRINRVQILFYVTLSRLYAILFALPHHLTTIIQNLQHKNKIRYEFISAFIV